MKIKLKTNFQGSYQNNNLFAPTFMVHSLEIKGTHSLNLNRKGAFNFVN